jgi:hypothetical protein
LLVAAQASFAALAAIAVTPPRRSAGASDPGAVGSSMRNRVAVVVPSQAARTITGSPTAASSFGPLPAVARRMCPPASASPVAGTTEIDDHKNDPAGAVASV